MDELKAYERKMKALDGSLAKLQAELKDVHAAAQACGKWAAPVGGLDAAVARSRKALQRHISEPTETPEQRAIREADEAAETAALRLAWAKALPDGEHLDKGQSVRYWEGALWAAKARVTWLASGTWPEHPDAIKDPHELASRAGISVDDARRALGLPVREKKPIPPMPR